MLIFPPRQMHITQNQRDKAMSLLSSTVLALCLILSSGGIPISLYRAVLSGKPVYEGLIMSPNTILHDTIFWSVVILQIAMKLQQCWKPALWLRQPRTPFLILSLSTLLHVVQMMSSPALFGGLGQKFRPQWVNTSREVLEISMVVLGSLETGVRAFGWFELQGLEHTEQELRHRMEGARNLKEETRLRILKKQEPTVSLGDLDQERQWTRGLIRQSDSTPSDLATLANGVYSELTEIMMLLTIMETAQLSK
ncbi:hypothetical protein KVV02_002537 [Mortierella alpina]|uniref:Uncharacterized protein n=1 Tax=Mortierella alpina TaxID=64518 RepID=A0A9P8A2Y4_MORAP|nr:hypothetical protein KVV02_002537 [Mortierella alpina]